MIFEGTPGSTLDPTKVTREQIAYTKSVIAGAGISVSAFQATANHIDPDSERRARANDYFVKLITGDSKISRRSMHPEPYRHRNCVKPL